MMHPMSDLLIQLIGVLGTGCIFWSFQQNKRSRILLWLIIGQILFGTHFALLGAWTGAAMNLIALGRGIIFYLKPNYRWAKHPTWPYIFIVVSSLGGVATWAGYVSLLNIVASNIETIGVWRNQPRQIRWFLLGVRPLYFCYSLLVGSYAGMVADLLFSASLILGMMRFDRKTVIDRTN
jgi:hypothetical protein